MTTGSGVAPAAPTNAHFEVGNQFALNDRLRIWWTPPAGSTRYNVKRSYRRGGPYKTVNTGYIDGLFEFSIPAIASNSRIPSFYVVIALNANGESAPSSEVRVNPSSGQYVEPGQATSFQAVQAPVLGSYVYGFPGNYQYSEWKIQDSFGNIIASGTPSSVVNGWSVSHSSALVQIPDPNWPYCTPAPLIYTTVHAVNVTTPDGSEIAPNYTATWTDYTVNNNYRSGIAFAAIFDVKPKTTEEGILYRVDYPNGYNAYTTDLNTYNAWRAAGYRGWGMIGRVSLSASSGVVRVYKLVGGGTNSDFVMTTSLTERNAIIAGAFGYTEDTTNPFYIYSSTGTGRVPLYRFFNSTTGKHAYTTDAFDVNYILTQGYQSEGAIGYVRAKPLPIPLYSAATPGNPVAPVTTLPSEAGSAPIIGYAFAGPEDAPELEVVRRAQSSLPDSYGQYYGDRIYPSYAPEYDNLIASGWNDPIVPFYAFITTAARSDRRSVYRGYNAGGHLFSINYSDMTSSGMTNEGIAWLLMPTQAQP